LQALTLAALAWLNAARAVAANETFGRLACREGG
jgi:hypothetical protein